MKLRIDRSWIAGCALIMTALTVGLYVVLPAQGHWEIDSSCYEQVARWIIGKEQLTQLPWSLYWGYSGLLALIYTLFGTGVWAVVMMQLFIALGLMYVTYRLAYGMGGQTVARIASALIAVNIGVLVYTQLVMTELLTALLLTAGLERTLSFVRNRRASVAMAAGFLFGCSVWVKPAALLFGPVLLIILLCVSGWSALLFGIGFYIPIILCSILNLFVCGFFGVQVTGTAGIYLYYLPKLIAVVDGVPVAQATAQVYGLMPAASYFKPHYWDALHQLFMSYVTAHPFCAVKVWMFNVGKTMFGLFVTQLKVMLNPALLATPGGLSITTALGSWWTKISVYVVRGSSAWWVIALACVEVLWTLARTALLGCALVRMWSVRSFSFVAIIGLYMSYFLMVTGHDGCGRYRMMIEPLLVALTAYAVDFVITRVGRGVADDQELVNEAI
jgi:hypothetical protein